MSILVLSQDALDYTEFLNKEADIYFATDAKQLNADQFSFDILLAQPDLAAQYLQLGGTASWIQSTWAGIEPLTKEEKAKSLLVTGVKEIFGPLIAQYVFAYLLDDVRDLGRALRAQTDKQWQPYTPETLQDRHLVILGTGSIGVEVAAVAKSFRMRVTGVSRSGQVKPGFDTVLPIDRLYHATSDADYFLIVLPGTDDTAGLINADVLATLPSTAMLLNVGRGVTLNEDALVTALQSKLLRKAVLDVFQTEPLPAESSLWDTPNTYITPHISAVSYPHEVAKIFLHNLDLYRAGESLDYLVDLDRGY
ncbi:MAG: D-2-hydroxyacid dehydrogenase [Pseudomonadales bacterium]|nr:D-2-hydroxyacid dehydrogenase [Pseudomonadales bacterium]